MIVVLAGWSPSRVVPRPDSPWGHEASPPQVLLAGDFEAAPPSCASFLGTNLDNIKVGFQDEIGGIRLILYRTTAWPTLDVKQGVWLGAVKNRDGGQSVLYDKLGTDKGSRGCVWFSHPDQGVPVAGYARFWSEGGAKGQQMGAVRCFDTTTNDEAPHAGYFPKWCIRAVVFYPIPGSNPLEGLRIEFNPRDTTTLFSNVQFRGSREGPYGALADSGAYDGGALRDLIRLQYDILSEVEGTWYPCGRGCCRAF